MRLFIHIFHVQPPVAYTSDLSMRCGISMGLVLLGGLFSMADISAQVRVTQVTPDEVSSRNAELKGLGDAIPENELIVYEEMRRITDELSRYRLQLARLRQADSSVVVLDTLRTSATRIIQSATGLSCESPQAAQQTSDIQRQINSIADELAPYTYDLRDPWTSLAEDTVTTGSCALLRTALTEPVRQQEILQLFERLRTEAANTARANAVFAERIESAIQLLQQRQSSLQKKLNEKSTQQQLSTSLWLVILVIGVLSISAIIAVKLFPENLQIEWVASGQVIQFVTVMILLSVIMALGLAGILKENTLGTLLGGIAGYVLSQGVGRAAAREVTRKLEQSDSTMPTKGT